MIRSLPRLSGVEQLWWGASAVLLVLFAATLFYARFDARMLEGASVWAKPLKFQISLALHFATLALIVHFLSPSWKSAPLLMVVALLSTLSAAGEIAYIGAQAARQQASHFNLATPFHAAMYAAMAAGAVIIVVAAGVVGVAALDTAGALTAPVRIAIALGLCGGTVLTLIVAFTMGARLSHQVGAEAAGSARMALTGWSLSAGDLRVPHFFATHMIQAVPLGGIVAARLLPAGAAIVAVVALALVWTALTLGLFGQALAGRPIVSGL